MSAIGFVLTAAFVVAADKEPVTAIDFYERAHHRPDNEREQALADLNKAIELDPKLDGAISTRSQVLSAMGKYKEAIADQTLYLERHPKDYPTLFNRAGMYRAVKRYEDAIADYSLIIDGKADFSRYGGTKEHALSRSLHYRGNILNEWTKDYPAAIADYSKALEIDPTITELHLQRAEVYRKLGQFDKADADYREQYEINPKETGLLGVWAWQLATCPDEHFRNGERAIQLAKEDCEDCKWKIPAGLSTLAAAYAEAGRFDDAIKMQTRAIDENKLEYWKPIFAKRLETFRQSKPLRHDPRVKKGSP